jgi:hypothetical protein
MNGVRSVGSSVMVSRATLTGRRRASGVTIGPSRIRLVAAAIAASVIHGSATPSTGSLQCTWYQTNTPSQPASSASADRRATMAGSASSSKRGTKRTECMRGNATRSQRTASSSGSRIGTSHQLCPCFAPAGAAWRVRSAGGWRRRGRGRVGLRGIASVASSVSIATSVSTSLRSHASTYRPTISRSRSSPRDCNVVCWLRSGRRWSMISWARCSALYTAAGLCRERWRPRCRRIRAERHQAERSCPHGEPKQTDEPIRIPASPPTLLVDRSRARVTRRGAAGSHREQNCDDRGAISRLCTRGRLAAFGAPGRSARLAVPRCS